MIAGCGFLLMKCKRLLWYPSSSTSVTSASSLSSPVVLIGCNNDYDSSMIGLALWARLSTIRIGSISFSSSSSADLVCCFSSHHSPLSPPVHTVSAIVIFYISFVCVLDQYSPATVVRSHDSMDVSSLTLQTFPWRRTLLMQGSCVR